MSYLDIAVRRMGWSDVVEGLCALKKLSDCHSTLEWAWHDMQSPLHILSRHVLIVRINHSLLAPANMYIKYFRKMVGRLG